MEEKRPKKVLGILINLGLGTSGVVLIFLTVYLLGWDFLSGYLKGNDIGMAQTAASWFDRFFPNLPQWFPLHGSGVSLFAGIQIGASLITIITNRLLPINLVQAMHLWEFLAVYLTALGIFLYVWVKFKSFTAAVLAGVFYPLSNASWAWLSEIGLYANGLCFVFYPPTILALDLFLSEIFGEKRQRRMTLWFALTSLLAGLAILTHFTAGVVLFEVVFVYSFAFSLLVPGKRVKNFLRGFACSFLVILTGCLLIGFWLFPFLRYIGIVSRNLLASWSSFEQIPYITLRALFGFSGIESNLQHGMWYVFFARPVWILAILGIIFALFKKNKTAIITSFLFVFFVLYAVMPGIFSWLVKTFLIFWRDIYIRSLIPAIIFLPVLAAWGCLAFGRALAELALRKRERAINFITPVFALTIAISTLFLAKGAPPNPPELQLPCYQGYGRWWRADVDYCHFWDKLAKIDLSLSSLPAPFESITKEIVERLELSPKTRVDISPKQGPMTAVWSNVSDAPIVSIYWYPIVLNNKFWGYHQNVLYLRESIEPSGAIPELVSWFGIEYVFLHKSEDPKTIEENLTDPFEKYTDDYWEEVLYEPERGLQVKRFKHSTGLATWTDRPAILVLGRIDREAYEEVFRRAVSGALPYNKALLVEGRDDGRVDKYTLGELKKFDGLILYGQVYEDKKKADKLLSAYVKEGGRLFIESGWQYANSEWQTHQALETVPFAKLEWDEGLATSFKLDTIKIGGVFNPGDFGPFTYYNDTWNVATAPRQDLKNWGEVVFERNKRPIIVIGHLGQGRVVWSGMNLFGHLQFHSSSEEYSFTQKLFDWLLEEKQREDLNISFSRPHPDRVEFAFSKDNLSQSSLLWRENFYPDWRAYIMREEGGGKREEKLPIYRAGPNLMLMRLPAIKKGQRLRLEFKLSFIPIVSRIISLLTFMTLIIFLSAPKTLSIFGKAGKRVFSRLSRAVLEDEEY